MAHFKIDDTHRLKSGSHQWKLQLKSVNKNTGETAWQSFRYYTTIESAVIGCYAYFQRQSDADNVLDFMNDSKELLNKFTAILSPKFNVDEK